MDFLTDLGVVKFALTFRLIYIGGMKSTVHGILAVTMLIFGIVGGCMELTRPDGTKVKVLTTQAVETVKSAGSVSQTVEAVAPPGTMIHEIAWLVTAISGAVLGVNEMRQKSDAGSVANVIQELNARLAQAGIVPKSPPVADSSPSSAEISAAINHPVSGMSAGFPPATL